MPTTKLDTEPVTLVSNVVAGAIALLVALAALVTYVADFLPEKYKGTAVAVAAALGAVVAVLQRFAAQYLRGKVWSPASHYDAVEAVARLEATRADAAPKRQR